MTLEDLAYIAQIAGVIVIVITLAYLAIQVRQGAQLLRSESRQVSLSTDQGGVYKFIEFPGLGRSMSSIEQPTLEEKTQLMFWLVAQMRAREHEWLQYQSGALDGDTWLSYRDVIYFVLGTPRTRELWKLCSPYFNKAFVELVGEMISNAPTVDFWQRLSAID